MSANMIKLTNANAPVVALHSSVSDHSQWTPLVSRLENTFNVIAMDLPGYGDALERQGGQRGVDAVIAPLIRDIEVLGEPVHLVGHSFGGAAALKIALARPDLVRSLVLYEPAAFHVLQFGSESDRALITEIRIVGAALENAATAGNRDKGLEQLVDYWTRNGYWQSLPLALREKLVANAKAPVADLADVFSEGWSLDELENLDIPTLVLVGMESPQASQRTATMIAKSIRGAELALLPDMGHMAPVQTPEWVIPRIHQYIARVEKSAPHVSWPRMSAA